MKTFSKKLEEIFTAVTFAEAGEFDTAKEILSSHGSGAGSKESKIKDSTVMTNNPQLTTDSIT